MRRLGLVALLLLQGCGFQQIRPLRPYELATAPYRSGDTQSLVGSLMYEGGCLLFRSEDGSKQVLPIWPTGSLFEESLIIFHEPAKADQRVVVGEEIRIDGLPLEWPKLDERRFAPFQHQCGAEPFFVTDVTPAN